MISINVNQAASSAGLNLGKSNDALQKSLSRLSSGRRIVNSSDDAGGLAVSMKMAAAQKRTEATAVNLRNIQSYLDTQDGAFKIADKVLSRMSELTTLARDVTKNAGDVENTTVTQSNFVQDPWVNMMINGFSVGQDSGGNTIYIPAGSSFGYSNDPTVDSTEAFAVVGVPTDVATSGVLTYDNSDEFVQVVQMALQQTADMRAQNGAEMSRVNFAQDLLNINAINLEAANSRIIDVDVAAESSQLARFRRGPRP